MTKQDLLDMIVRKKYKEYRTATEELQPADLAALLDDMDVNNGLVAFRLLQKDVAAEAFAYMDPDVRSSLVEGFSDAELMGALERMSLDDAADLLEDMPASVVKRVLEKSSRETREALNRLLLYPEDSAGSVMTPEYVRLRRNQSVEESFLTIRRVGEEVETLYTCYVVEKNRLQGVVTARDLLLADPDEKIEDLMDDNIISVKVTDDREFAAREMQRYGFIAMPVVDSEGYMVGIITLDDAVDVLEEEATEDIQKMAAINPSEDGYFATSVWQHAKNRTPWLLILMLSATFTGMILNHYETAFAAMPLLVGFIPMLMDTPGNCGNQSSTLMVRGMALGEIEPSDIFRVAWKELRVALLVGLILGVANGLRIYLMYGHDIRIALLVSCSLVCAVTIAKLIGCGLPLLVKRLGGDPAIMASPFITTLVDAFSIIVYFSLAVMMFPQLR